MNYFVTAASVLALLALISFGSYSNTPVDAKPITIGAVLPLTGPAAIWGESIRNGMLLAQEDAAQNGVNIKLMFEDSQGTAAQAVSAYRTLVDVHHVDLVVSALSRASMPLILLADADRVPLVMTVVSAEGAPAQSAYAYRFYNTAAQYVEPYFTTELTRTKYTSLAVVYVNDEFGVSVRDAIQREAATAGIQIVKEEYFAAGASDFRAQLTSIKAARPDAVLFVAVAPAEATALVKQARELGVTQPLFDGASALANASVRSDLGTAADNTYVSVYPIALGKTGATFTDSYERMYAAKPHFSASLGFDIVQMVSDVSKGVSIDGPTLAKQLSVLKTIETQNGTFTVDGTTGEMNPTLYMAEVVSGQLVEVR